MAFCFLSNLPEDSDKRQKFLFDLVEGKECEWVKENECATGDGIIYWN